MTSGSSLSGQTGASPFDLETQRGVAHVLASVRASALDSDRKNELRDLIFLYTNGGRDQSVRLTLEQKLVAYQVAALPIPDHDLKSPGSQFHPFGGDFRTDPTFMVPSEPDSIALPPVPAPTSTPLPVTQSVPVAPVAPPPQVSTVAPPVVSAPPVPPPPPPHDLPVAPTVQPVPPMVPASPIAQSAVAVPVTPAPIAQPVPPSVPVTVAPPASSAPSFSQEQILERIREIKARVNEKVGNPVNLVDIDNQVGREYMSALLDAMKKLNSGTSVTAAMQRLETAYVQVENVLANRAATPVLPTPPVMPTGVPSSVAAVPPASSVSNVVPPPVPPPVLPTPTPGIQAAPPTPAPVPPVTVNPPVILPLSVPVSPVPAAPVSAPKINLPEPIPVVPNPVASPPSQPQPDSSPSPTTAPTVPASKFPSLAQSDIKLRTPNDLPTEAEKYKAESSGDPLFAPDVDEGLQQLLAEWKIFKKSGLFGTGPKGRQHPLFIKLASLQIPLILAGRFEGSTQEIKQSITDYMNGWRYEQGIIYEQGETFEHYLRRIIRHILNLQHRRKGS